MQDILLQDALYPMFEGTTTSDGWKTGVKVKGRKAQVLAGTTLPQRGRSVTP